MTVPDEEWVTDEELASLTKPTGPTEFDLEALRKQASKYLGTSDLAHDTNAFGAMNAPRKTKYPWTEWIDKEYHTAVQGKHFDLTIPRFQVLLHRRAADLGIYVKTERVKGATPAEVGFMFHADREALNAAWAALAAFGSNGGPEPEEDDA